MPFESKAQQRYMFAKHPKIAKRWAKHTPDMKALPEKKMEKKAELVESFNQKMQKEAFVQALGRGAAKILPAAKNFFTGASKAAPAASKVVGKAKAVAPAAATAAAPAQSFGGKLLGWGERALGWGGNIAMLSSFMGGNEETPSGGQDPSAANAMAAEAGRQSALYGSPGGNMNVTPEQDVRHSMERAGQGAPLAMYRGTNVPKIPTAANLLPRR